MTHLLDDPISDPLSLYRYRDGISAVDLLATGISHLDFFTWLADHPSTFAAITAHFGIHPRPTDVMLTLFTAQGLIQQNGGCYHLTLRAREHLSSASRWNLAPYFSSMKDRQPTLDMLKVLKTGKPANFGSFDPQAWAQAMQRPDFAAHFTAAMDCRGILLGPAMAKLLDLSQHTALLDIAGGSGIYACALSAKNPHLRCTVLERAPVDRIATECIAKQGCSERVDVHTGDIFADRCPRASMYTCGRMSCTIGMNLPSESSSQSPTPRSRMADSWSFTTHSSMPRRPDRCTSRNIPRC